MNELFHLLDQRMSDISKMGQPGVGLGNVLCLFDKKGSFKKNEKARVIQEIEYVNLFFQFKKVGSQEISQFQSKSVCLFKELAPDFKFRFAQNDLIQNLKIFAELFDYLGNNKKCKQIINMIELHQKSNSRLFLLMIQSLQEVTRLFFYDKLRMKESTNLVPIRNLGQDSTKEKIKKQHEAHIISLCLSVDNGIQKVKSPKLCALRHSNQKLNDSLNQELGLQKLIHLQGRLQVQYKNKRIFIRTLKLEQLTCKFQNSDTNSPVINISKIEPNPYFIVQPYFSHRPRSSSDQKIQVSYQRFSTNPALEKQKSLGRRSWLIYYEAIEDLAFIEGRNLSFQSGLKIIQSRNTLIGERIQNYLAKNNKIP